MGSVKCCRSINELCKFQAKHNNNSTNIKRREKYLKSLSDLGYNMMIDDADAGIVSRVPCIVFDRQDSLEVISIKPVTRESIREFKKQM